MGIGDLAVAVDPGQVGVGYRDIVFQEAMRADLLQFGEEPDRRGDVDPVGEDPWVRGDPDEPAFGNRAGLPAGIRVIPEPFPDDLVVDVGVPPEGDQGVDVEKGQGVSPRRGPLRPSRE